MRVSQSQENPHIKSNSSTYSIQSYHVILGPAPPSFFNTTLSTTFQTFRR